MESLFLLEHVRPAGDDGEDRKRIGVYESEAGARNAVDRLRAQPGFCDYPGDFVIQRYETGKDYWTEGYGNSNEAQRVRQGNASTRGATAGS